jgi:hypothetical protein
VKQLEHVTLCASGFVTDTATASGACAVVVPVMVVASIVDTVSAEPPNETVAPAWKPLPAIVTAVPPPVAPLSGLTDVMAGGGGGAPYVKHPEHVPVWASGFVTMTSTAPTACAVVVPVIEVALRVATASGDPPKDTVAPLWKSVPVTVTAVPPGARPVLGVTEVTDGAGVTYVKHSVQVPLCASRFVTTTFTAPVACAVVVPVMLVGVTVDTLSAEPPNDAVAPAWKPLPLTVTVLPPAVDPLLGVTDDTVGGGPMRRSATC